MSFFLRRGVMSSAALNTFSPGDISDLEFWIRGSDGLTDKSSNAHSITNNGVTTASASLNGYDTFSFDGSSYATTSNLMSGSANRSMIVLYKSTNTGSYIDNICGQATGQVSSSWFIIQSRTNIVTGDPYLAGYSDDLGSDTPDNAWKFAQADYNGTTAYLYKDGTLNASGAKTLNTETGNFYIGADNETVVGDYLNGEIAEIIVYSKVLSSDERSDIGAYFTNRYAL